ncbi:nuclear transport factor 2 family protein [Burkholderia sp. IMCC1007]|uniref:nuclear transport factor 2 family protein n=1 Tax=Burkholderia sp. IMCC1007 TaxID=3004104 RepID=UPI0022B563EC|nr:nuclear transport factor 2 family protein [Burkholderia sp. IMCC1007]
MKTITQEFAQAFSQEWIDAWNSHDLDRILSHYADGFEMSSPLITQIMGGPSGTLQGKDSVRAYWEKALKMVPDLRFESIATLIGAGSIVIHYRGANGRLAAEVFLFGPDNLVQKAFANYAS